MLQEGSCILTDVNCSVWDRRKKFFVCNVMLYVRGYVHVCQMFHHFHSHFQLDTWHDTTNNTKLTTSVYVSLHRYAWVCYLSILHYNQPSLVEDCDNFCTAMSHNSTSLILHQHSEWTLFSVTYILLTEVGNYKNSKWDREEYIFFLFYADFILDFSISYLDQDILAEAWERVLEAIKRDVMPLPHGAAHTITHLLCAAPLSVLTHTAKPKVC